MYVAKTQTGMLVNTVFFRPSKQREEQSARSWLEFLQIFSLMFFAIIEFVPKNC